MGTLPARRETIAQSRAGECLLDSNGDGDANCDGYGQTDANGNGGVTASTARNSTGGRVGVAFGF